MKNLSTLLLSSALLFFLAACSDKKPQETKTETNTTVVTVQKEENTTMPDYSISPEAEKFVLRDIDNKRLELLLYKKNILINNIPNRLILINFFSTWCPPCKGQIPYLADLQKKYPKALFVVGVLVNDAGKEYHEIDTFIKQYGVNYFVSGIKENDLLAKALVKTLGTDENFRLPLTVLYKNGRYYTHYEGATPIEMINFDIQKALEK